MWLVDVAGWYADVDTTWWYTEYQERSWTTTIWSYKTVIMRQKTIKSKHLVEYVKKWHRFINITVQAVLSTSEATLKLDYI